MDYIQNEPEAKHVNSKQYFRMMKRRIKKVMDECRLKELRGKGELKGEEAGTAKEKPKYIYESRHKHALLRLRGKDGKFLASNLCVIQRDPTASASRRRRKEAGNPKRSSRTAHSEPQTPLIDSQPVFIMQRLLFLSL